MKAPSQHAPGLFEPLAEEPGKKRKAGRKGAPDAAAGAEPGAPTTEQARRIAEARQLAAAGLLPPSIDRPRRAKGGRSGISKRPIVLAALVFLAAAVVAVEVAGLPLQTVGGLGTIVGVALLVYMVFV